MWIAANFVERQRAPVFFRRWQRDAARLLQMFGQIAHVDEIGGGGDGGARNDVFQFADIAGPVVLHEHDLRAPRKPLKGFSVRLAVFLQEMLHQHGNVLGAFDKPGHADFDAVQAVEKIFAESAGQHFRAQVAVGGGDQAHIHFSYFRRSDALNFAVLDHAQKLGLHLRRRFADFIEKHGSAIGIFEQAGARFGGAGKRAANVAEKLAFEQRIHQRRAVADGKALAATRG